MEKLAIIGIDSLDPYIILKYKDQLKNFSDLIDKSPSFISKSIFPVDTIPAWGSIYSGLHPGNHGLLYTYDIFDPNLKGLDKLNVNNIKGKTFWDHANTKGYRSMIIFPTLIYPSWEINGAMITKSIKENRIDWITAERSIDSYPDYIKDKYNISNKVKDLWGGFPGNNKLQDFINLGKLVLERDKKIGIQIFKKEKWDLFFIYFSHLDIIQHRLWRYFDHNDPTFKKNQFGDSILEYYKIFDHIIGEYLELSPDIKFMVISDHGHMIRPVNTVNINEILRRKGYLISNNNKFLKIRKSLLKLINRFNLEQYIIKIIVKNEKLNKISESIYSSSNTINPKSMAFLSNFAGIKSYPHGGIIINRESISDDEYNIIANNLIELLSGLTISNRSIIDWVKKREELYPGKFTKEIYPDIIFELKENYGVGWDIDSDVIGNSYDHNIASGGHRKDAVFLMKNINKKIHKKDISIIDISPTILDILEIDFDVKNFDGKSIFK